MKRLLCTLVLLFCSWTSVLATDVTLSATSIPNFNPSNLGANIVVGGVTVAGASLSCSACLRPTWVGLGGFTVSITGNQGPQDYVVLYVASTSSAVLATSTGLNTTTSVTFYPYVEFRIYANQAFQPLGETYIVQPGSPGTGAWYKRYAASVVPVGAIRELRIPSITIAATTDSPGPTNQARYTAAFYRPDNSLVQFYNCFEQFAVPPTTPSTWTALCAYNSSGGIVPPTTEAYTKPQIDARFPSCTAGQMIYYSLTGNVQNCLIVGNGLQLSGGILSSTGPGGLTGSGTAGYIPKFTGATALGNSIAREVSGLFRVDGRHLVSFASTQVDPEYGSSVAYTYNPGNVTANQPQSGVLISTTVQSGINTLVTGLQSALYITTASNTTSTALSGLVYSSGSGGVASLTGASVALVDEMTGGSASFVGFRVGAPSRGLNSNITSYTGFLNTAPTNLTSIANYSALESTGGKFVLTKKFTSDEVGLTNAMPLRFYTTTALNPAQDAWVGFALGAAPATNYTYLWPTTNVMADKHLTIDAINGQSVSLKWASAMEGAGNDTEIQFNNAGMLAGDSRLTFDPTTGTISMQGAVDFRQTSPTATPVTLRDGKRLVFENPLGTGSFTLAYGGTTPGNYNFFWPTAAPTANQVLRAAAPVGSDVDLQWATVGSGTVTSVGMTVPSILSVTPASINSSGTFAVTLATQVKNRVFAGPTTGVDAAPTFRSLVVADLPTIGTGATIADPTMTLGSDGTGDTYYRKASGALTRLGIGSTGQVLTVSGGLPSWQTPTTPITLNSTDATIPVRSNSSTLVDSPLRVASGNVALYPSTASGASFVVYNKDSGVGSNSKRVQLGTWPGDPDNAGALYMGNVTPTDLNHILRSTGSGMTQLNAPGASGPFLLLNVGDSTAANGSIEFTAGGTSIMSMNKNYLSITPLVSSENALRVDAVCQVSCISDVAAVQVRRGAMTTNAPIVLADLQAYHYTSTTATGFGARIRFGAETTSSNNVNQGAIDTIWTTNSASPTSNLVVSLVSSGTTLTEFARLTPTSFALRNGTNLRALLTGDADYTAAHPGTGTGLILPRGLIGSSGFSEGSGIWWIGSDETGFSGLNGIWLQNGMNWQGENGNEVWKFHQWTDSSTTGASIIELNPSVAEGSITLYPYAAGSTQTTRVKFYELTANGSNFIGLQAPDSVGSDVFYQLPERPNVANMVLTNSTAGGAQVALQWTMTSGSGNFVRTTSPTLTTPSISGMLQLHTATWANRPTAANGGMWYCTDCQVTSSTDNTCTGGNATGGALAVGVTTSSTVAWRCFATQN